MANADKPKQPHRPHTAWLLQCINADKDTYPYAIFYDKDEAMGFGKLLVRESDNGSCVGFLLIELTLFGRFEHVRD